RAETVRVTSAVTVMPSPHPPHPSAAAPAERAATDTVAEIEVRDVSKSYGAAELAKTVVRDCSFAIDRGRLTVMIGPSGCGKSTLIRLLAGFERPHSGPISIGGKTAPEPRGGRRG